MSRFLAPVFAGAVIIGAAMSAAPASAQSYDRWQNQSQGTYSPRGRNEPTASGDPWLNENDFDYNRRHWLPNRDGARKEQDRRYGQYRSWRPQGDDAGQWYRSEQSQLGRMYAPRDRDWYDDEE